LPARSSGRRSYPWLKVGGWERVGLPLGTYSPTPDGLAAAFPGAIVISSIANEWGRQYIPPNSAAPGLYQDSVAVLTPRLEQIIAEATTRIRDCFPMRQGRSKMWRPPRHSPLPLVAHEQASFSTRADLSSTHEVNDPNNQSKGKSRTWAMICICRNWLATVLPVLGWVLPILIWQIKRTNAEIDAHGRIVLNWIISSLIYGAIGFVLTFILIGVPLRLHFTSWESFFDHQNQSQ
jgi:hypothetical protein